jgi:hypothetical protein
MRTTSARASSPATAGTPRSCVVKVIGRRAETGLRNGFRARRPSHSDGLYKIRTVPPAMIDPLLGFGPSQVRHAYVILFPDPHGGFMDHVKMKVFSNDDDMGADVRGDQVEEHRERWRYNGGRRKYLVRLVLEGLSRCALEHPESLQQPLTVTIGHFGGPAGFAETSQAIEKRLRASAILRLICQTAKWPGIQILLDRSPAADAVAKPPTPRRHHSLGFRAQTRTHGDPQEAAAHWRAAVSSLVGFRQTRSACHRLASDSP